MSVAITAVPVVASDVQAAPAVANDVQAAPFHIEQALANFVPEMPGDPLGDASRLANPAALASELLGGLNGYLERARSLQMRMRADGTEGGGGIDVASLTPVGAGEPELHGGPARERLEPVERDGGVSAALGVNVAQLQRTMDLALASMNFFTETALVVHGTSQINNSANTLFKGQ